MCVSVHCPLHIVRRVLCRLLTVGGVAVYPLSCLPKLLLQISTVRRLLSKAVLWAPRTGQVTHTEKKSEKGRGREGESQQKRSSSILGRLCRTNLCHACINIQVFIVRYLCQAEKCARSSRTEVRVEWRREKEAGKEAVVGVELPEWVTHKRSQLRPQRFIVVIYLPSLLLIFTPHTVYKVLHSLCLLLFLYLPLSTYFSLFLFPSLSVCLSVHQSGMLTAYLFIHFLIY